MTLLFDRRTVLAGTAALAACVPLHESPEARLAAKLRIIGRSIGGTLGVNLLDPLNGGLQLGYNEHLRFPMCSTFKCSLAALVLTLDHNATLDASERITWSRSDLLSHAPFARERLAAGATLLELARAAQVLSDNTAANLLLERVGGPAGLTAFWRELGDDVSRLDRFEPRLNFVPPGEIRDTTTPSAMAHTLAKLIVSTTSRPLVPENQALLMSWMAETRTGLSRVRAGLPADWKAGDKTGSSGDWPGMGHARGDIGFVMSPGNTPVIFAVYHSAPVSNPPSAAAVDSAFAEVGSVLTAWTRRNWTIVVT